MKRNTKKHLILFGFLLLIFPIFVSPEVSANPALSQGINSLFQSGLYGSGYPVFLKNASVEIDCYSNYVTGIGTYQIENLNDTSFEIPVYFSHFYFFEADPFAILTPEYNQTIDLVTVNGNSTEFTYNCTYLPCENMTSEECFEMRRNLITFNITMEPLETVELVIQWSYDPNIIENIYLTGYTIYSMGWNRSIEYEEVVFRFHTPNFYKDNQIYTYIANQSFHEFIEWYRSDDDPPYGICNMTFYDWQCSSTASTMTSLRDSCNKTILDEINGTNQFTYNDTNITENCYIIIVNPFLTNAEIRMIKFKAILITASSLLVAFIGLVVILIRAGKSKRKKK
jgi:hypothetical protein